jgi:hypothetical protein
MATTWQEYQEDVAEFFRSIALEATTNHTVRGARTKHAIDVYVKSHHVGFDVVWIVECKHCAILDLPSRVKCTNSVSNIPGVDAP